MREKIKILQVVTRMGRGGAETMIMNYYRCLDRSKYQFDFLVHRFEKADYDEEIKQLGGHIFHMIPIRPYSYFKYFRMLDEFFKNHASEYVAVHCHIQENSGFVCKYAAKYGIKNRVCTSHIADLGIDYKYPFRQLGKIFTHKYVNIRLSCGIEAGRFLYGNKSFMVFPNAINALKYRYNETDYNEFRANKGWGNRVVIGHIGRFEKQKNHTFLLEIFSEFLKQNPQALLVLLGNGGDFDKIRQKAKKLGVSDSVIFEGIQTSVCNYLKAFDVFLFPSLFEGLPVSVIEAQAAGLKCFLSDTIDKGVDISGDIEFISLHKDPAYWAERIYRSIPYNRLDNYEKVIKAKYDVLNNIDTLLDIYTKG